MTVPQLPQWAGEALPPRLSRRLNCTSESSKSSHQSTALKQIESVLYGRDVLYPSAKTPLIYAEICHRLEQRGVRIPSNDIWIAAVAMEKDLPLIGRDEHFTRVKGLKFIPC